MSVLKKFLACLLVFAGISSAASTEPALLAAFEDDVRPVLKSLCYECHGPEKEKGEIRFDRLDPDLVNGPDAETWHDVLDQLNLGEMPLDKAERQPTPDERRVLTEWLDAALRAAAESEHYNRGRVVTRRLADATASRPACRSTGSATARGRWDNYWCDDNEFKIQTHFDFALNWLPAA